MPEIQFNSNRSGLRRGRFDSVTLAAAIAMFAYGAFLYIRLQNAGWDASIFVCAGDQYCDPGAVPPGLSVGRGSPGYDGQFYYRLALAPLSTEEVARGIRLDSPAYRSQRILYPVLAGGLADSDAARVRWTLVLVNFAAIVGVAGAGGAIARELGRHALWGLGFALWPGLILTLSRDLTEAVSSLYLLLGVLYVLRRAPAIAAVMFAAAVLARETTLIAPLCCGAAVSAGYFVPVTSGSRERDKPPRWAWTVLAAPLLVFALWQSILAFWWNEWPMQAGAEGNFVAPLSGWLAARNAADAYAPPARDLWNGEMVLLIVCGAVIAWRTRRAAIPTGLKIAWAAYTLMAAFYKADIWYEDWGFLRALTEWWMLGVVILLAAPFRGRALLSAYVMWAWLVIARTRLHE